MGGCVVDGEGIGYMAFMGSLANSSNVRSAPYDLSDGAEIKGNEAIIYETDFDRGDRVTRVNLNTGKILEVRHYNCLE